jgi:hypothetical protein
MNAYVYHLSAEGFWRCNTSILMDVPEIVVVTLFWKLDMPFSLRGTGKWETRRLAHGLRPTLAVEPIRVYSSLSPFYLKREADTVSEMLWGF